MGGVASKASQPLPHTPSLFCVRVWQLQRRQGPPLLCFMVQHVAKASSLSFSLSLACVLQRHKGPFSFVLLAAQGQPPLPSLTLLACTHGRRQSLSFLCLGWSRNRSLSWLPIEEGRGGSHPLFSSLLLLCLYSACKVIEGVRGGSHPLFSSLLLSLFLQALAEKGTLFICCRAWPKGGAAVEGSHSLATLNLMQATSFFFLCATQEGNSPSSSLLRFLVQQGSQGKPSLPLFVAQGRLQPLSLL